jgi:hypothetical protein
METLIGQFGSVTVIQLINVDHFENITGDTERKLDTKTI